MSLPGKEFTELHSHPDPSDHPSRRWFILGLVSILLVSLALRFWGLGRFNSLVFDEVYYAKFAHNYLTHTPFFDGHPPLSKYLIALGMAIGNHLPIGQETANTLTGSRFTTWSYRWLNALTGSLIPLVVAALAYQLSRRRSYAIVAGLFAAADGLFLVESRYALNNVYLVLFGLLGQWFFLKAIDHKAVRRQGFWLALAGIFFGACAGVKWNGLWFLLGAYLFYFLAWGLRLVQMLRDRLQPPLVPGRSEDPLPPLKRLTQINPLLLGLNLAIVPFLTYWVSWIPHLQMNPGDSFWGLQKRILEYHESIGATPDVHPYCSAWYTWPLMVRPVAYFYEVAPNATTPVPGQGPVAASTPGSVIYDVHAMGNPFLWWLSTAAIVLLAGVLFQNLAVWVNGAGAKATWVREQRESQLLHPTEVWIGLYLLTNYLANLAPWMRVTRCVFLYHYMGSAVFATMAIAWLVDRWLYSPQLRLRRMALTCLVLVMVGFVFWMPIYLGLPLSQAQYQLRMWFPRWI